MMAQSRRRVKRGRRERRGAETQERREQSRGKIDADELSLALAGG
jgi:hypothetical protein